VLLTQVNTSSTTGKYKHKMSTSSSWYLFSNDFFSRRRNFPTFASIVHITFSQLIGSTTNKNKCICHLFLREWIRHLVYLRLFIHHRVNCQLGAWIPTIYHLSPPLQNQRRDHAIWCLATVEALCNIMSWEYALFYLLLALAAGAF
jgi:hypothetical protein